MIILCNRARAEEGSKKNFERKIFCFVTQKLSDKIMVDGQLPLVTQKQGHTQDMGRTPHQAVTTCVPEKVLCPCPNPGDPPKWETQKERDQRKCHAQGLLACDATAYNICDLELCTSALLYYITASEYEVTKHSAIEKALGSSTGMMWPITQLKGNCRASLEPAS